MKKFLILFLLLLVSSFSVFGGVVYEFNGKTGWNGSSFESPCCDAGYHTNYGRFLPGGDFTISAVDAIVWYHASAGNVYLTLQEFNGSTWTDIATSDPAYVDYIYLTPVQYHFTFTPLVSVVYDSGKQYRLNIDVTNTSTYYGGVNTSTPYQYPAVMRVYNPYPITLGWPLETSYASRSVNQAFGVDWSTGQTCNDGVHGDLVEKHNGTDFAASSGTVVYAAEAGTVKHMESHSPWAQHIVIEHTHPDGWKYTTVYWHVDSLVTTNDSVTKGQEIATVANLGGDTHFHFGVRIGAYNSIHSGTGALPQTECVINSLTYQPFPFGFINPNDTDYVQYQ